MILNKDYLIFVTSITNCSPLSGPRRYEYVSIPEGETKRWIYSRYLDVEDKDSWTDSKYLSEALIEEMNELFGLQIELDI